MVMIMKKKRPVVTGLCPASDSRIKTNKPFVCKRFFHMSNARKCSAYDVIEHIKKIGIEIEIEKQYQHKNKTLPAVDKFVYKSNQDPLDTTSHKYLEHSTSEGNHFEKCVQFDNPDL
ncbi:hypothetical protein HELRODRAFT_158515 [Helobdella robusta]|uniref:Uncharacterized protein n=1 Tax=Helobdella robusta TaxID=6412 RepID=T1EMW2_HELRO|nr:hypothetical protein HELRODRAFT_158515 [Helobdella robusta]ESO12093.1 hypothetical protein HELRODRAFT_158515 [Helobdella robusta]